MSRFPCGRVVDTYWCLCGQPFFLPVSFFAFTLGLSTCDVFLFLISVVCRVVVAVSWADNNAEFLYQLFHKTGAFSKLNFFASPQMRNDGTLYLQGSLKESQEEVRVLKNATKEAALTAQELAEARTKSQHLEKDVQRLKVRISVLFQSSHGTVLGGWSQGVAPQL